jgi:hypothetical protein
MKYLVVLLSFIFLCWSEDVVVEDSDCKSTATTFSGNQINEKLCPRLLIFENIFEFQMYVDEITIRNIRRKWKSSNQKFPSVPTLLVKKP